MSACPKKQKKNFVGKVFVGFISLHGSSMSALVHLKVNPPQKKKKILNNEIRPR